MGHMVTLQLLAMRPILCVIDLTESSAAVLETAVTIAGTFKAHLIILFPYRLIDYAYTGDLSVLNSKLVNEAKAKFNVLKQQGSINHTSYEFLPEIGFPSDRIKSFLKTGDAIQNIDTVCIKSDEIKTELSNLKNKETSNG